MIFAAGAGAGYLVPHRLGETQSQRKIAVFHGCIARLKRPLFTRSLSWDETAKERAMTILGDEADCVNMSGIGGLSPGEVECASGYSEMPYEAYRQIRPPAAQASKVERIVRTHRKSIDSDYCAGRVTK